MTESLTLKKIGPIQEATIEPKPLTIIIGKQASGKSLVAQLLYFFRSLKNVLAKNYSPRMAHGEDWDSAFIGQFLNDLRGVPFASFVDDSSEISWREGENHYNIQIDSQKGVILNAALRDTMKAWLKSWASDKKVLEQALKSSQSEDQIFIPTDRSIFTRLWGQAQSVLFAPYQPQPLRLFGDILSFAYPAYRKYYRLHDNWPDNQENLKAAFNFILECQRSALGGEAYAPIGEGPQEWQWKLNQENIAPIPIEAASSGQMEGWPFFVIASTLGILSDQKTIYFEEPETHLHPRAQVEVMRVIAFLLNRGQRFVITTHSPFLLYVVNNMIQRHLTYKGNVPDNEDIALDPDHIVAYRLGKKTEVISNDRETRLLDLCELENVADDLGGEFERLLYMTDEAD